VKSKITRTIANSTRACVLTEQLTASRPAVSAAQSSGLHSENCSATMLAGRLVGGKSVWRSRTQLASADQAVLAADRDAADPNARSCRTASVIGSTLPRRACKTAAEWERYDADFANCDASCRTDPQPW
jgi:hypothetical protein